mgnify:CR=1 FL=1
MAEADREARREARREAHRCEELTLKERVNVDLLSQPFNTIDELLEKLDLGKHCASFNKEEITLPRLFFVTDRQLSDIKLDYWERVKLLRCVQLMKDAIAPDAVVAESRHAETLVRPTLHSVRAERSLRSRRSRSARDGPSTSRLRRRSRS